MSHNLQAAAARDVALPDHRILALQGRDAVAFAQAQFMNDVAGLAEGQWQWNGWLTPKGRVIALFALLRRDADTLWLLLPDADPAALATQLQRYVFRSKTTLQVRDELHVSGGFDPPRQAHGASMAVFDDGVELDWSAEGGPRRLRIATIIADAVSDDAARWRTADLRHGLPRLGPEQVEQWTPQQLSLERLQSYSVKKGCYPGQEIVARTHFLGQAKRGLWRLEGPGLAAAGDILSADTDGAPARVLGRIVCAEGDEALAVLPWDIGDEPLRSGGVACVRLPLLGGLAR